MGVRAVPMQTFVDSTALVNDGAALSARLKRDGYLFIRGLLDPDTLSEVRRRLLHIAADVGWLDESYPVAQGVAKQSAACKDPEDAYMRVFKNMWADEALHRLRTDPNILGFFTRIFDEPAFAHPMFVQRNIFPQTGGFDFTTKAHQDKVHIGGATNYALWAPLSDVPLEKGPLAIAAGSHKDGVLDTRVGTGAGGMDIAVDIPGTWVTGAFAAGDALIFADVTVHQALPNLTREIRQSFDARYQPIKTAVADKNLDTYPGTGTWKQVYANWTSTDQQYYWHDLDLNVVPLDRSYYDRRDEMAFAMAEQGDIAARDALLRIAQRDPDGAKRARAQALLRDFDRHPHLA